MCHKHMYIKSCLWKLLAQHGESCDGTRIQDAVSCADVHLYRDEGLLSPSFILLAQRFQVGDAKNSDWHWLDNAQLQNGVSRLHGWAL